NRRQILNIVKRAGTMPAVKHLFDLLRDGWHNFGTTGLGVQHLDRIRSRVTFQKIEWNKHGFPCDLGLAERGNSFFEDADNSESQLTDANIGSNGVGVGKNLPG